MPILASSMYVNAYGKAAGLVAVTGAQTLDSMHGVGDTYVVKYNSSGKSVWSARIASTLTDVGFGIARDSGGNIYVTGQGSSGAGSTLTAYNFDGTAFGTTLANSGSNDVFIIKYDTDGIVLWVTRIASTSFDIGYAIATDSSGGLYVAGQSGVNVVTTAFSSNGVAFSPTLASSGGLDAFVVKYNTSGIVQWVARVASTADDRGFGIATDLSGNVCITGQGGFDAVMTAFSSDGVAFGTTIANSGSNDAFIVKYNTSGIVQWVARVASNSDNTGNAIITDSVGNVYVTGVNGTSTTTAFSSNGVAFGTTLTAGGSSDGFIVKYNTDGIVQWFAKMAGSGTDVGYAIAIDSGGNLYVTGVGQTGMAAFSSNGVAFSPPLSASGAFVVKYNTGGFVQWIARVSSAGADSGYAIATDSSDNVYVTGASGVDAVVTAFSSNGVAFGTTLANSGSNDAFIVKYNTSGIVQWVTRLGSAGSDSGRALTIDSTNNIYTTGAFTGTRFSVYGKSLQLFSTLPNAGGTDAFVVKYNTNGAPQWAARVSSTGTDLGYGIATDLSGNVYIAGQGGSAVVVTAFSSNGVAFSTTLANSGSNDAFIVKYDTDGIVQWVARVASTGVDAGYAIATDLSGNVYITGQGGSGAVVTAFNSDELAFGTTIANSGSNDAFIVKYNTNGFVQWVARVATLGADIGYAIATDLSGNAYVTGQVGQSGGVAPEATAFSSDGIAFSPTLANSGPNDAFIVKYNTSGIVQWVARVASTADDIGFAIATDPGGNVYVAGQGGPNVVVTAFSSNGVAFGTTLANSGNSDAFIVKYDTDGIVQWIARLASIGTDVIYAIATDSSGNVYVTGVVGSVLTAFSSDGVAFPITITSATSDLFFVKYNTNGIVQWVARVGGAGGLDGAYGIATDSIGNVYLTGNVPSANVTIFNSNQETFASLTINGAFTLKFDENGFGQWIQVVRGTTLTSARGRGISVDSFGNSYITGNSASGQVLQVYNADNTPYLFINTSGGTDAFVVKYSTDTIPQWIAKVGSSGTDIGYGIVTDLSGNVYVAGSGGSGVVVTAFSSNGVAFPTTIANSGSNDAFIVKYNTTGSVQWVARVASNQVDIGYAVRTDSNGDVYFTGQGGQGAVVTAFSSDGVAFSPTITSAGSAEVFIVKYNTNGIVQWVARVGGTSSEWGHSLATDLSGNVFVAGRGGDAAMILYSSDGSSFGTAIGNSGSGDGFIVKYDTAGFVQWGAKVQSTTTDTIEAIASDLDGNVYVTGRAGSAGITFSATDSNGDVFFPSITTSGAGDAFVVKFNTAGLVQWLAKVGSSGADNGFGIATDLDRNVYVTGSGGSGAVVTAFSSNGAAFSPTLTNAGLGDVFIVKYNTSGIVQWATRVSSTASDVGYSIATDLDRNVYVTGSGGSGGSVAAYNSDGVIFGSATLGSPTGVNTETFIVKYNSSGVVQWISKIGGSGLDLGKSITLDLSANFYITGQFNAGALVPYNS